MRSTTLLAAVFAAATAMACSQESRQETGEDVAAARSEAAESLGEVSQAAAEEAAEDRQEAAVRAAARDYEVAIAKAEGDYHVADRALRCAPGRGSRPMQERGVQGVPGHQAQRGDEA